MRTFARLLRAEWTKFRTVRGWIFGLALAAFLTILLGALTVFGIPSQCGGNRPDAACTPPLGHDGKPVNDRFSFVHQPLLENGSITARVASLTGLLPTFENSDGPPVDSPPLEGTAGMQSGLEAWAKAGLIIKESMQQGSDYAAIMVTGEHGVRMQHNYTHDTAGSQSAVSTSSPRWLRLTRAGNTITGYESPDGTQWTAVDTVTLPRLPREAQVGLFVASPGATRVSNLLLTRTANGAPTQATAVFDNVTGVFDPVTGIEGEWKHDVLSGGGPADHSLSAFEKVDDAFIISGSGNIAPALGGRTFGTGPMAEDTLIGVFAGLIVIVVVATLFMTTEYRRRMIAVTFAASPARGRVLAAKVSIIGSIVFVVGLFVATVAVVGGNSIMDSRGIYVFPASGSTQVRMIVGSAALLAIVAIFAVSLGAIVRRSAGAVMTVVVVMVIPYILATASLLPVEAARWLLRVTPAAAFAVQQSVPQYSHVDIVYSPAYGYYPLSPLAGLAVLCAYTVIAFGVAMFLVRRRDA